MYTITYFSATGNTKYLVDKLAKEIKIKPSDIHAIDELNQPKIKFNEHVILMYPIHGFNPPRTVMRFVKNLTKASIKKVSLVAVGCNNLWINDAVSTKLRKSFEKASVQIIVDEIIAMPLTLVMDFPAETKTEVVKKAETSLLEIIHKISSEDSSVRKVKLKSKIIHSIGKLESPAARLFGLELHAKKSCTSCGICWNNCPENNIKEGKKSKPKFGFSCSMCMRCVYSCPEQAITPYISKFLTIKGGYKLPSKEE